MQVWQVLNASLAFGIAFNNFDRFVETLSGKYSLHDTAGIAYQLSTEKTWDSGKKTAFSEKTNQEGVGLEVKPGNE